MSNVWTWPPTPPPATLTTAQAQALVYGTGSRPLWVPPAVKGALDDEFDSNVLDPAWKTRNLTTGPTIVAPAVGSFNENNAIVGAATVPNISLNTQGRKSWLSMATTTTGPAAYQLYKTFTWVSGQFYWCRTQRLQRKVGTAAVGSYALSIWADLAGVPDNNNRCFVQWDLGNLTCRWGIVIGGVSTNVTFNQSEGWGTGDCYVGIANPFGSLGASANWYGEMFTDDGRRLLPVAIGGASFQWTPAYIGWQYLQDLGVPLAMQVDFVRENTGHPLLHNA